MLKCEFCSRVCSSPTGLAQHTKCCRSNPDRVEHVLSGKKSPTWVPHTEDSKAKLRSAALSRKLGGRVNGSGRGKKGTYKGYFCDSSWELAWIIFNLDHNIKFERNQIKFPYEFEGKTYYWIPDFVLPDGSFVEIKGYDNERNQAKRIGFSHSLKVLKEKDLKPVFTYVTNKYGKDYIRLYDE